MHSTGVGVGWDRSVRLVGGGCVCNVRHFGDRFGGTSKFEVKGGGGRHRPGQSPLKPTSGGRSATRETFGAWNGGEKYGCQ